MMWALIAKAFAGTILETLLKGIADALQIRIERHERDAMAADAAVSRDRASAAEAARKTQKDMADAQAAAPRNRRALAERLRTEARADGEPGA
jgi:hypothetical protein